jgi:hypothetical protein
MRQIDHAVFTAIEVRTTSPQSKALAYGSVCIKDCVWVKFFLMKNSKDGTPFLSLPSSKRPKRDKPGEFVNEPMVWFPSPTLLPDGADLKKQLLDLVLSELSRKDTDDTSFPPPGDDQALYD